MKDIIEKLNKDREILESKLEKVNTAIESLQDVCKHEGDEGKKAMQWIGNGHNRDYYMCDICGFKDSY